MAVHHMPQSYSVIIHSYISISILDLGNQNREIPFLIK